MPRGGPDGGDGGRGGDVIAIADSGLSTLLEQRLKKKIAAEDGMAGSGSRCHGRDGLDEVVRLPVGTAIWDSDRKGDAPWIDLTEAGQRAVLVRGGRGGRGNARFATATRQTPDTAERGRSGETRKLRLSLKVLADVGLIGLPNAGKSTLLRRLSSAKPRVAAYPFTTLVPHLGVVEVGYERFVVADIPGLIPGASQGIGLGDRFLRHVERTRVLVHLLDMGGALLEERDVLADYEDIRRELTAYGADLCSRSELVVLNKIDLIADRAPLLETKARLEALGHRVYCASGATGEGIPELTRAIAADLDRVRSEEVAS